MRETAFEKARRLLTEGRIIVRHATPQMLTAQVRGDSARLYQAGFEQRSGWFCTCDHVAKSTTCSHIQALELIWLEPMDVQR